MRLLRHRGAEREQDRPEPDEAPLPQPERSEPRISDPGLTSLSARDWLAVVRRAFKEANRRHVTNLAAALAYYAFLAIPSALLVALGIFGILASPDTVSSLIDTVGSVMPGEASSLLRDSLTRLTHEETTASTIVGCGGLLALWSVGGAMQNVMWALNEAYDREESRGFVRRRLAAWAMAFFVLVGFALTFGLLVLGPKLSVWVGEALDAKTPVQWAWWIAEWPLVVFGLLLAFAGVLYLGPDVDHPRWRFLTPGAVFSLLVWLAGSGAFAFYVSRFGSYNKSWGSLSAVVVLLTWLWLSALALLLGAEINAEAERSRELRAGQPAEAELQVPPKD